MSSFLDTTDRIPTSSEHEGSVAIAETSTTTSLEGHRPHRCPRCGHVEYTDSKIAGTCVFCPGLVELLAT